MTNIIVPAIEELLYTNTYITAANSTSNARTNNIAGSNSVQLELLFPEPSVPHSNSVALPISIEYPVIVSTITPIIDTHIADSTTTSRLSSPLYISSIW